MNLSLLPKYDGFTINEAEQDEAPGPADGNEANSQSNKLGHKKLENAFASYVFDFDQKWVEQQNEEWVFIKLRSLKLDIIWYQDIEEICIIIVLKI